MAKNGNMVTLIQAAYIAPTFLCMNEIINNEIHFKLILFFFFVKYLSRLPWNQNTFLGWLAEQIFSTFFLGFFCLFAPLFLTLLVCVCNYHKAIYKMYRFKIANIDAVADFQPFPTDRVKKLMHESILFHISAKE